MGIWDGIRTTKPKPHGLLGIERASARHSWVKWLTIGVGLVLLVLFFADACSQQV